MVWGYKGTSTLNFAVVDQIEDAVKNKIETITSFRQEPIDFLQRIFREHDVDGSCKLRVKEFIAALSSLGLTGFEDELKGLFQRYDLDRSGRLDFREFCGGLFRKADFASVPLLGKIRQALCLRQGGFFSLRGLSRQFGIMDRNRNNVLDREEFKRGLALFLGGVNVKLRPVEYEKLFDRFDLNKDGYINYSEFIRVLRGEMNEFRTDLVKLAFKNLDTDGSGIATLDEIASKYDVSDHPQVRSGEMSVDEAMKEFLSNWDQDRDTNVSLAEFIEYYQWISPSIDEDDYFELMIRNAWHISGGSGWSENTTCRRVLVTHPDGSKTVEEITDDLGIGKGDIAKMKENLRARGIEAVELQLYGGN